MDETQAVVDEAQNTDVAENTPNEAADDISMTSTRNDLSETTVHDTVTTKTDQASKTAIITGCNAGIGKVTALEMAKKGLRVIMACRNIHSAEEAKEEIVKVSENNNVIVKQLDLNSLDSVRKFCDDILATEKKIDYLVNNAGILGVPYTMTEDDFEMHIGVNHLAHFLMTIKLLPLLKNAESSRIIVLTSKLAPHGTIKLDDLHYKNRKYSPMGAYCASKLANMLFTVELAKKLQGTNVTVYGVHPGVVDSNIYRNTKALRILLWPFKKLIMKTNEQGAMTTLYCAFEEGIEKSSGKYFADSRLASQSAKCFDEETAAKLWHLSEQLVGLTQ